MRLTPRRLRNAIIVIIVHPESLGRNFGRFAVEVIIAITREYPQNVTSIYTKIPAQKISQVAVEIIAWLGILSTPPLGRLAIFGIGVVALLEAEAMILCRRFAFLARFVQSFVLSGEFDAYILRSAFGSLKNLFFDCVMIERNKVQIILERGLSIFGVTIVA